MALGLSSPEASPILSPYSIDLSSDGINGVFATNVDNTLFHRNCNSTNRSSCGNSERSMDSLYRTINITSPRTLSNISSSNRATSSIFLDDHSFRANHHIGSYSCYAPSRLASNGTLSSVKPMNPSTLGGNGRCLFRQTAANANRRLRSLESGSNHTKVFQDSHWQSQPSSADESDLLNNNSFDNFTISTKKTSKKVTICSPMIVTNSPLSMESPYISEGDQDQLEMSINIIS